MFPTSYTEIADRINAVDPVAYGKTRNYVNGAVTKLSPYIARGVISTKQVLDSVLAKGYKPSEIEQFIRELAWRDYYQQVWLALRDDINKDIRQQTIYNKSHLCHALHEAKTGIKAIDEAVVELQNTGYIHNHLRMYMASLACNIAKYHWLTPARWMHYYLLDADWASNALSWQWVAGGFSSKKYYANQDNINKYTHTNQRNTYLDCSYDELPGIEVPKHLEAQVVFEGKTNLPEARHCLLDRSLPAYVYNMYNLDCLWHKDVEANRILLLEPSYFKQYPVCERTINFILDLSKNISGIVTYVGEFSELFNDWDLSKVHYKEHPTNRHYKGNEHKRTWMFDEVKGYYPSFFAYWKKCERYLQQCEG